MDAVSSLKQEFWKSYSEVGISGANKLFLVSFLAPLKYKNSITHFHYLHSLWVGLLARQIGRLIYHQERPLFFDGALHDLGKCQTHLHISGKTDDWSEADQRAIEQHVTV
ncbi:MAG: hypothetical protein HYT37_02255 [Candidatus Sungbacteria bacterium]|nr:hypothetical protein [Candidatus Sungbacteria bacterium]